VLAHLTDVGAGKQLHLHAIAASGGAGGASHVRA
jgi:hypothetical protein